MSQFACSHPHFRLFKNHLFKHTDITQYDTWFFRTLNCICCVLETDDIDFIYIQRQREMHHATKINYSFTVSVNQHWFNFPCLFFCVCVCFVIIVVLCSKLNQESCVIVLVKWLRGKTWHTNIQVLLAY